MTTFKPILISTWRRNQEPLCDVEKCAYFIRLQRWKFATGLVFACAGWCALMLVCFWLVGV